MKTPVIIPAFNEADTIGATLRALDATRVEPFVVVNGEQGWLDTAEAASSYTPHVFLQTEQGKMPAVQLALRKVLAYDSEAFGKPIIMTDADSVPLWTSRWSDELSIAVAGTKSARAAAGPIYFRDGPLVDTILRNTRRFFHVREARGSYVGAIGANMVVNFANDPFVIDEVMNMPHIWPGEDRYLLRTVSGNDLARYSQLTSFGAAVVTSSRFLPPLFERFSMSPRERQLKSNRQYIERRAAAVAHFYDEDDGLLHEYIELP